MNLTNTIENNIILITGANRGIGKAITEGVLAKGAAKVYAAVRDVDSAQPLIAEHGDRVVAVPLDLTSTESVNAAAAIARDAQIVINNGGVLKTSSPLDAEAFDDYAFETNVNVLGLMRVAQAFAPVLKANGGGALVQLNSVASLKAFADFATYSASKAAAYSMTQSLKDLLKEQGTQVVSVHPGPIKTDMADAAGFGDMCEPPSLVADAIIDALASGSFHAFPDSMAQQVGAAYAGFATNVVEADFSEG